MWHFWCDRQRNWMQIFSDQNENCLSNNAQLYFNFGLVGWLVVGFNADCLTWDLGIWVECSPWESFYGILSRIYGSFGENHRKLRTTRLTSATEEWTWHLPSTSFWAQPLVGPWTDSLTPMPYPGLEFGTFGAVAGYPNHYTGWSAL